MPCRGTAVAERRTAGRGSASTSTAGTQRDRAERHGPSAEAFAAVAAGVGQAERRARRRGIRHLTAIDAVTQRDAPSAVVAARAKLVSRLSAPSAVVPQKKNQVAGVRAAADETRGRKRQAEEPRQERERRGRVHRCRRLNHSRSRNSGISERAKKIGPPLRWM